MPSLYENFDNAHDGEAMTALGDEFGLTPTRGNAARDPERTRYRDRLFRSFVVWAHCSGPAKAMSYPTVSPMARRNNACAGS